METSYPRIVRYHLDGTASRGGVLIDVKASLPPKTINLYDFSKDMQCVTMKLYEANKKYI